MRHHLLVAMFAILAFSLQGGQWHSYPFTDVYRNACYTGADLYMLKGSTLARADLDQWAITKVLMREDGLSGNDIFDILYSSTARRMAIVYNDALIDVIHPDGTVWTITDLYTAPMAGTNKTIRDIREQQGQLFVSTAFGFVVIDLYTEAVLHTIHLGKAVHCAWAFNGVWYYSSDDGTFYCQQTDNPYNPASWHLSSSHVIRKALIIEQDPANKQCWLLAKDQSIRRIVPPTHSSVRCTEARTVKNLLQLGKYVLVQGTDSLSLYDTTFGPCPTVDHQPLPGQRLVCPTTAQVSASMLCPLQPDSLQLAFVYSAGGIEADSLSIHDGSFTIHPLRPHHLQLQNQQQSGTINRLQYDGNGQIGMAYVAATNKGYAFQMKTPGFLTTYQGSTGQWNNYDATVVSAHVTDGSARFVGLLDFCADPTHAQRYWYSTLEDGIVGIDRGKFLARYNKNNTNQGLENYSAGCTRVAGLAISPQGDLWCINDGVKELLRVRETNGTWRKFLLRGLEKSYGFTHLIHTRHGGRNQLWGCQEFTFQASAIFCYDYGADVADQSDDRFVTFRTFQPTDAASFTPFYGRGVFEGPNGAIWLLNTSGLYVIDEPDSVFTQPGVIRTVLTDAVPTAMVADNQEHLWVATEQQGLYLLSADGREQLAHLTTDNSQLTSNEILSLAYDAQQSTLWIAIEGQLFSYTYDEREFGHPEAFSSSAWCHPGSAPVGTRATINVFGLASDTQLTVQNTQGRTVAQSYAWGNHATIHAEALPIGTYFITGTDSEGHQGQIGRFEITP